MRVLLADDEPLARDLLRALLAATADVEVVGEVGDGVDLVDQVEALAPDLVILDIEMPGRDGMTAAGLLRHRSDGREGPAVIFATAHGERAVDAFGLDAVDYLMKPIRRERLAEALDRARRRRPLEAGAEAPAVDAIWVPTRRGRLRAPLAEISHVTAARDHVYLHLNGRPLMVRMTMGRIATLAAPFGLTRVHRSVLVRAERIVAVVAAGKAVRLRLDDGTELPVGPAYRARVRAWTRRLSPAD